MNAGLLKIKIIFVILNLALFCLGSLICDEPWGKDADLIGARSCAKVETPSHGFLVKFGEKLVRFHQEIISPADGPRSHFIPSSSQYALDAMHKYGFFTGYIMGCDRLMRENNDPWVYLKVTDSNGQTMKWNPVP